MHSFQHTPLVCWTGYGIGPRIKGNPGPCWIQEPGLARRMTAPRTVASGGLTFDPGPSPVGRGQLLSGVRRQKQDQSHSDKQSEYQTLHGLPSFWACAAPGAGLQRKKATVQIQTSPCPPHRPLAAWRHGGCVSAVHRRSPFADTPCRQWACCPLSGSPRPLLWRSPVPD